MNKHPGPGAYNPMIKENVGVKMSLGREVFNNNKECFSWIFCSKIIHTYWTRITQ